MKDRIPRSPTPDSASLITSATLGETLAVPVGGVCSGPLGACATGACPYPDSSGNAIDTITANHFVFFIIINMQPPTSSFNLLDRIEKCLFSRLQPIDFTNKPMPDKFSPSPPSRTLLSQMPDR